MPNRGELAYLSLMRDVLENGVLKNNRTGVPTRFLPGAMLKFDMAEGFPLLTSKKVAYKAVLGELIGFLRGYTNAAQFRALGCTIWDQNANEEPGWLANPNRRGIDDLGVIYGAQWRNWERISITGVADVEYLGDGDYIARGATVSRTHIDQVAEALRLIVHSPESRRILWSAWRPDKLNAMALPPCHVAYEFLTDPVNKKLHLTMWQRSADLFLGVPFNIASCAFLLHMVARITGYTPGTFTHFMSDVHLYENHLEQAALQLSRQDQLFDSPTLSVREDAPLWSGSDQFSVGLIDLFVPEHFSFGTSYQHHPAIKAPMAV